MEAEDLPPDGAPVPLPRGQKFIIQLFLNMFMLHIKLKRITNAATWPSDHPILLTLGFWSKVQITTFQIIIMLHIKLKGISNAATW